jgi:tetratricopeptide (TPR) repeat protein
VAEAASVTPESVGSAVAALEKKNKLAVTLGGLVSLAVHVEPELLRYMRLRFLPRSDASAEADLWFSPLVQARSRQGMVFLPEAAAELRKQLATRKDLDEIYRALRRVHQGLPPLLELEETLTFMALSGRTAAELDDALAPVLAAMVQEPRRKSDLSSWAIRALARQPEHVRRRTNAWLLGLAASAHLRAAPALGVAPPDDLAVIAAPELLPPPDEDLTLEVRRSQDWIEISAGPRAGAARSSSIRVPDTDPRIVIVVREGTHGRLESQQLISFARGEPGRTKLGNTAERTNVLLRNLRGQQWRLQLQADSASVEQARRASISWLHVSDLGCDGDSSRNLRGLGQLLEQEARDLRSSGQLPDLMFVTGDVTARGRSGEFAEAARFIDDAHVAFGQATRIIPVPGNHDADLSALKSNAPMDLSEESVFWRDAEHPDRAVLELVYGAYLAWQHDTVHGTESLRYGVVPGDFVAVFAIRDLRVGVVALNTRREWLDRGAPQIDVSPNQLSALFPRAGEIPSALPREIARWRAACDLTFLVTHYPAEAFGNDSRGWFEEVASMFDVHLCGSAHGRSGIITIPPPITWQAEPLVRLGGGGQLNLAHAIFGEDIAVTIAPRRWDSLHATLATDAEERRTLTIPRRRTDAAPGKVEESLTTLQYLVESAGSDEARRGLYHEIGALIESSGGMDERAAVAYQSAIDLPGNDLRAADRLERLYTRNSDHERLVDLLERKLAMLSTEAEKVELGFKIARLCEEVLDQPERAVAVYRRILESQSRNRNALDNLERLFIRLERWHDLAEVYAAKADLTTDPSEGKRLLFVVGQIYERELADRERAIETYQRILELDPNERDALAALDHIYQEIERWYDLVAILEREADQAAGHAEVVSFRFRSGEIWRTKLKDAARAVEAYGSVLAIDPTHQSALDVLESMAAGTDEPVRAAQLLVRLFEAAGEWKKVVALYEIMARHVEQSQRPELLLRIASIQERRLYDPKAARDAYSRALTADPSNVEVSEHLVRLAMFPTSSISDDPPIRRAPDNRTKVFFDETIPSALASSTSELVDLDGVYLFRIDGPNGGAWTLNLTAKPKVCRRGEIAEADGVFEVRGEDFTDFLAGGMVVAMRLFFEGKLTTRGRDPNAVVKVMSVLAKLARQ